MKARGAALVLLMLAFLWALFTAFLIAEAVREISDKA